MQYIIQTPLPVNYFVAWINTLCHNYFSYPISGLVHHSKHSSFMHFHHSISPLLLHSPFLTFHYSIIPQFPHSAIPSFHFSFSHSANPTTCLPRIHYGCHSGRAECSGIHYSTTPILRLSQLPMTSFFLSTVYKPLICLSDSFLKTDPVSPSQLMNS